MTYRIWRLSEAGPKNLGVACTGDGLVLGTTALIERRDGRFVVRAHDDIERLLQRAYQHVETAERLMPGLVVVAHALNANDPCMARIAAVHLKIPDLPNAAARGRMEAEDYLIKSHRAKLEQSVQGLDKASPDDPKHPGWPAGTPGGRGGKFRPKDGSGFEIPLDVRIRIIRLAARRALRLASGALLRMSVEGAANVVPILDVVADVALAFDVANTILQFRKLTTDATAAFDFSSKGPYSLEELQVLSNGYEEFASYDAFVKGELALNAIDKRFGGAGDGYQYHHIVTQGGANANNPSIFPEQLQNTDNIICLPTLLHEVVNGAYSNGKDGTTMTMYEWLQTQPYDVQREEGLKILRQLHILQ
jgi:hypothetical protein